jgi:hypothetical protein
MLKDIMDLGSRERNNAGAVMTCFFLSYDEAFPAFSIVIWENYG